MSDIDTRPDPEIARIQKRLADERIDERLFVARSGIDNATWWRHCQGKSAPTLRVIRTYDATIEQLRRELAAG